MSQCACWSPPHTLTHRPTASRCSCVKLRYSKNWIIWFCVKGFSWILSGLMQRIMLHDSDIVSHTAPADTLRITFCPFRSLFLYKADWDSTWDQFLSYFTDKRESDSRADNGSLSISFFFFCLSLKGMLTRCGLIVVSVCVCVHVLYWSVCVQGR